ncbi:MAG TPA: hypothetical protein VFX50_12135, partial [Gemmatimonadales bacterium]|nr:hypothetical protein [Gemmatimonadales bacterium]
PAPGTGRGGCEMARLLVHRVRLEDGRAGGEPVVAECDVLAPTEWNFHPEGAVARVLARLPAPAAAVTVRLPAAAVDPGVALRLAPRATEAACTR